MRHQPCPRSDVIGILAAAVFDVSGRTGFDLPKARRFSMGCFGLVPHVAERLDGFLAVIQMKGRLTERQEITAGKTGIEHNGPLLARNGLRPLPRIGQRIPYLCH